MNTRIRNDEKTSEIERAAQKIKRHRKTPVQTPKSGEGLPINQIVKDVKVVDPAKGARPAALQETIKDDLAVKTGVESRAELLFQDKQITSYTISSFSPELHCEVGKHFDYIWF